MSDSNVVIGILQSRKGGYMSAFELAHARFGNELGSALRDLNPSQRERFMSEKVCDVIRNGNPTRKTLRAYIDVLLQAVRDECIVSAYNREGGWSLEFKQFFDGESDVFELAEAQCALKIISFDPIFDSSDLPYMEHLRTILLLEIICKSWMIKGDHQKEVSEHLAYWIYEGGIIGNEVAKSFRTIRHEDISLPPYKLTLDVICKVWKRAVEEGKRDTGESDHIKKRRIDRLDAAYCTLARYFLLSMPMERRRKALRHL